MATEKVYDQREETYQAGRTPSQADPRPIQERLSRTLADVDIQAFIADLLGVIEAKIVAPATPVVGPRSRALAILRTETEKIAALAQFYGIR